MTREQTAAMLAVLSAAWPDRFSRQGADPEAAATAYHLAWADLPFDRVEPAVRQWLESGRFFPAPAEIRALVVDAACDLPAAEIAWGEVKRQVGAVGSYGCPAWSSPALERAVAAIGWRDICLCEEDQLGTLRAHFFRTYEAYRSRYVADTPFDRALEEAERRRAELAAPPAHPALPASAEAIAREAIYRAQRGSYVTERARARFEAQQPAAASEPRPDMLALLQTTPGWALLPEEYRARLLARRAAEREPAAVPAGGGGA